MMEVLTVLGGTSQDRDLGCTEYIASFEIIGRHEVQSISFGVSGTR